MSAFAVARAALLVAVPAAAFGLRLVDEAQREGRPRLLTAPRAIAVPSTTSSAPAVASDRRPRASARVVPGVRPS